MDGTLTQGRLVFALADKFDLAEKVTRIQSGDQQGHIQTREIAALFRGISRRDLETAVESIPLTRNCERTIARLKEKGSIVGILSDSYTAAAGMLAARLGMDFVAANELEIVGDRITGRVVMPLGWEKTGCFCKLSVCKRFHLEEQSSKCGTPLENTMAVGDTKSDLCMLQRAGIGVAFMPKDEIVTARGIKVICEPDLANVLQFV
jgi:phosphoserine phosphatase